MKCLILLLFITITQTSVAQWVCGSFASKPANGDEPLCEGDCMTIYDSAAIWNNVLGSCTHPVRRIWAFYKYDTLNPFATEALFYDTIFDSLKFAICDFPKGQATVSYQGWDSEGRYTSSVYLGHITVKGCPPISSFELDKDTTCSNDCIRYYDKSRRKPSKWVWCFDGGFPNYFSGQYPPPVCYDEKGIFQTKLITSNDYGIDSAITNVIVVNCKSCIYLPNAFSPNGDGVNDYFQSYSICPFKNFEIMIFNRWGEKIFQSNNSNFMWDGTFKGQLLDVGVYTYLVSLQYTDNTSETYKGTITLLK